MVNTLRRSLRRWLPALLVVGGLADDASAATLKGRFVLNGVVPAPVPIVDPRTFREFPNVPLRMEDVLVDPKTSGIANVVVWVRGDAVPVTPDAANNAPKFAIIDSGSGQFRPRIVGLWHGKQTLIFQNSGQVPHNFKFSHADINPLMHAGQLGVIQVPGTKLLPQEVSCNIHPWMKAYVVIRAHPYVAATTPDGYFVIEHLPEGVELEFQVWHERSGYLDLPGWVKGRFTKTLGPGETDLGVLQVPRGKL